MNPNHRTGIPLGRVFCGLEVVRILLSAGIHPDTVVERHRLGKLPGEAGEGGARLSWFRFKDRDGDNLEIAVSTHPGHGGDPETLVTWPWGDMTSPQNYALTKKRVHRKRETSRDRH